MWSKSLNLIIVCLTTMVLFTMCGCDDDQGPSAPQGCGTVRIDAIIDIWDSQATTAFVMVSFDNCLGVPQAMINGINLVYREGIEVPFTVDNFPLSPGDFVRLYTEFTQENGKYGSATASIRMPGPFEIITPDTPTDFSLTDSTVFAWTSSSFAEYYYLQVCFYYHYNNGENDVSHVNLSYMVVDTVMKVEPSVMFPNLEEIQSLQQIYCTVTVIASCGPESYQFGNIEGNAMGILNGKVWEHKVIDVDFLSCDY